VAVPQSRRQEVVDICAAIIVAVAVFGYILNWFGWQSSLGLVVVSGILYFNPRARNTIADIIGKVFKL
jgi:hypothetical protein